MKKTKIQFNKVPKQISFRKQKGPLTESSLLPFLGFWGFETPRKYRSQDFDGI